MNTELKIQTVAKQLFIKRGYEHVSINLIAEKANITKGGIYHHFESKEQLFWRVLESVISDLENQYKELLSSASTLKEALKAILHVKHNKNDIFGFLFGEDNQANMNYVSLLLDAKRNLPDIKERIARFYSNLTSAVTAMLESAQEKDEISNDINCEALAAQLIFMVEGVNLISMLIPSTEIEEAISKTSKHLLKSIEPG